MPSLSARHPLLFGLLVMPAVGMAAGDDDLCLTAAARASVATGVPEPLLQAIAIVESRQSGSAWPWTLNVDGDGSWYPDRPQAEAAARAAVDAGKQPDIGCFQINTRWHGAAFPTVEAMFEPDANALYAAQFLLDLHHRHGNWPDAIAAYHSADEDRGAAYLARVAMVMADAAEPTEAQPQHQRQNGFPLLMAGDPASVGSVVPRLPGRTPLVGSP